MLTASRALSLHAESGKPLPLVPELEALYRRGNKPRYGELNMIVGRSGSQKSGFGLWLCLNMHVPTLYFSGDMSGNTASGRLAASVTGHHKDTVQAGLDAGGETKQFYIDAIRDIPITFSFGKPITWQRVDEEMQAYVELWDAYPHVVVFDNLMDFDGCETEYQPQMEALSDMTEFARETGAGTFVMHHASDKSWQAQSDPWRPAGRNEIKNGLSEKPALTLSVGLDRTNYDYHIAAVKDRNGPDDPTGQQYITLTAEPDKTRFFRHRPRWVSG